MKNVSNALPRLTNYSLGELEKHIRSWKSVSRSSVNLGCSHSRSFCSYWSMEQTCYLAFFLFFFKGKAVLGLGRVRMHAAPPHPHPHPHRHPALQGPTAALLKWRPASIRHQEICEVMNCAALYSFYLLPSHINGDKLLGCKFESP